MSKRKELGATRFVDRSDQLATRPMIEGLELRRLFATVPAGFTDSAFGATISNGTGMEFAPDGRLFVTTQPGALRVVQANGTLNPTPAITLTVDSAGERGLLGIAFDPQFAANQFIYLYYTVPAPAGGSAHNRVSRFTVSGDVAAPGSELPILDLDNLSSATNHNGGSLHFGSDGKLYVSVGENANSANSQSVANRLGKILRINSDGTIPADNPTTFHVRPTSSTTYTTVTPTGLNRAIWALGLRNPYTTFVDPLTGTYYINDVGEVTWEEINIGAAGANYGWPRTEGDFNTATPGNELLTRPIYTYGHNGAFPLGNALTGSTLYRSTAPLQFPTQYQGKYFFADNVSDWIGYVDPTVSTSPNAATLFATNANGIVGMKLGADGAIYYLQRESSAGGILAGVRKITSADVTAPTVVSTVFDRNDPQHKITVTLSEDVSASFSTSDVSLQTVPGNATVSIASAFYNAASHTIVITPTARLADGRFGVKLTGLSDSAGNALAASLQEFRFLTGDADGNATVNFDDLLTLAQHYGQTSKLFSDGDFNYDTVVNFDDLLILSQHYAQTVAASPALTIIRPVEHSKSREEDAVLA